MPIQHWSDQIWVVQLLDEPALSEDLTSLRMQAESASDYPDAVIDLSGVTVMTSSHLSHLLRLRKAAIDHDAHLRLTAVPDSVWVVFLTTGLDKMFEFAPDVPTALAGLQLNQ